MLLLGESVSAEDAARAGLVTAVTPDGTEAHKTAARLASLPPIALSQAKILLRAPLRDALKKANREEMSNLVSRMGDPEAAQALLNFTTRKAKL